MRDSRPQSIEKLLDETHESGALQQIQQRALALNKLNRSVRAILPEPLHPWVRVANFRHGILVIEVASANWLMRLRYEQSTLLSALRAQILPSLTSINISINPSLAVKIKQFVQESSSSSEMTAKIVKRQLGLNSAEALRSVAERSPEKLKRALERLASLAGEEDTSKTRLG